MISWAKICRHKCEDIEKTQDVNAALLVKLGWGVITNLDNIWVKVV